jgi:hypothetical protein
MKWLIALAVFGVWTATLQAAQPQWTEVTKGGDGATTYADVASVRHAEGRTLVWFLNTGGPAEKLPIYVGDNPLGATYKSSVTLVSFECTMGRFALLQMSYYSDANMGGRSLGSTTTPDKSVLFSYPTPGTVGSAQLDYVCKYLSLKKK